MLIIFDKKNHYYANRLHSHYWFLKGRDFATEITNDILSSNVHKLEDVEGINKGQHRAVRDFLIDQTGKKPEELPREDKIKKLGEWFSSDCQKWKSLETSIKFCFALNLYDILKGARNTELTTVIYLGFRTSLFGKKWIGERICRPCRLCP